MLEMEKWERKLKQWLRRVLLSQVQTAKNRARLKPQILIFVKMFISLQIGGKHFFASFMARRVAPRRDKFMIIRSLAEVQTHAVARFSEVSKRRERTCWLQFVFNTFQFQSKVALPDKCPRTLTSCFHVSSRAKMHTCKCLLLSQKSSAHTSINHSKKCVDDNNKEKEFTTTSARPPS